MVVADPVVVVPPGADGGLQHRIASSRHSFRARRLLSTGESPVAQGHSAGAPGDLRCHQGPERAGRPGDHHAVSRAAPTGKLSVDVSVADGGFVTVVSVVNALELKDHLNKQAKTLSAGLKRKVRTRSPQQSATQLHFQNIFQPKRQLFAHF